MRRVCDTHYGRSPCRFRGGGLPIGATAVRPRVHRSASGIVDQTSLRRSAQPTWRGGGRYGSEAREREPIVRGCRRRGHDLQARVKALHVVRRLRLPAFLV